jgi:hypothetical protein
MDIRYEERERELNILGLLFLAMVSGPIAIASLMFTDIVDGRTSLAPWPNLIVKVIGLSNVAIFILALCAFVAVAAYGLLKDIRQ